MSHDAAAESAEADLGKTPTGIPPGAGPFLRRPLTALSAVNAVPGSPYAWLPAILALRAAETVISGPDRRSGENRNGRTRLARYFRKPHCPEYGGAHPGTCRFFRVCVAWPAASRGVPAVARAGAGVAAAGKHGEPVVAGGRRTLRAARHGCLDLDDPHGHLHFTKLTRRCRLCFGGMRCA